MPENDRSSKLRGGKVAVFDASREQMPEFLPNSTSAIVTEEKIRDYLLNHANLIGASKARFFTAHGFSQSEWEILKLALLRHARTCRVRNAISSFYGVKFEIEGPLICPDGRQPRILSIWQMDNDSLEPRFITAYPVKV